uniref:Uncharacterized protein n=1 Tax=Ascaris lumbricoides TaxID=6252 RepID=A0A0M3HYC1_ASCLU
MVAGTSVVVACAVGAYLYFTNKRACDEKLNSWIEQLSETQADSEDDELTSKSVPQETTESQGKEVKVIVSTKGDQIRQLSKPMSEITEVKEMASARSLILFQCPESKDPETTDASKQKSVHLEKELVEEIIQKLRSTENGTSQKYISTPTAPQAQSQLVAYPYPYAQNAPVPYRNAPIVYQQPNMPPGVMIHPSSPIVWTAVQMTPQPNITPRKHSKRNSTEEERKAKRKKRSKKKKSSKRKHHKAKKEGKNTESTDEEEREERRRRKEKRAKRKRKNTESTDEEEREEKRRRKEKRAKRKSALHLLFSVIMTPLDDTLPQVQNSTSKYLLGVECCCAQIESLTNPSFSVIQSRIGYPNSFPDRQMSTYFTGKHSKRDESNEGKESKPVVTTPKTDSAQDTPATPKTG